MKPAVAMTDLSADRLPTATIGRILVSLALALLLWGWVTTQRDPLTPRSFNDVPIQTPELAESLLIAGDLGSVSVRLEGPRSLVQEITAADLEPHLDLDDVDEPGSYTVPVEINVPDVVETEITPAQLTIIVDRATSRPFDLDAVVTPVEDGSRRVGEVVPAASEVIVTGPQRLVDQVARVVLPIEIGERTSDFTGEFTPVAIDFENQQLQGLEIRPRRVTAVVAVEARGRSVPVLIQTAGNPAEGYEVIDRVVNPSMVLLDGPDAVLDELVSVSTEPVNIEGATEPVTARVGLTGLPPEVQLVDPRDGSVVVVVQFRRRGVTQTLPDQRVLVADLPPGFEAVVEPETLDVVVFAAEETLRDLRAGDVAPRVSVAGRPAGSYALAPTVALPPGVQWIRTEPETVRVTLRPIAATPMASPVAGPD